MTLRLQQITKWFWCLVFLHVDSWIVVKAVAVKGPPNPPATVEAQAKFFQDFFSVQLSPYKIEFGHVCEDPNNWEQRYEKKDFKNHRDMGKVRWGDKKGGYGEHYWDLNHAGHNNDNNDHGYESNTDDGSYNPQEHEDPYDEPSDHSPTFDSDYNPDKSLTYDETNRAKRAHQKRYHDEGDSIRKVTKTKPKYRHQNHDENKKQKQSDEEFEDHSKEKIPEYSYRKTPRKNKQQYRPIVKEQDYEEDDGQKVVTLKDLEEERKPKQFQKQTEQFVPYEKQPEEIVFHEAAKVKPPEQLSPYEGVGETQPEQFAPHDARTRQPEQLAPFEEGVRVRHHSPQPASAAPIARLYLESSTGHVIDRATGQAYILQPVALAQSNNKYYN